MNRWVFFGLGVTLGIFLSVPIGRVLIEDELLKTMNRLAEDQYAHKGITVVLERAAKLSEQVLVLSEEPEDRNCALWLNSKVGYEILTANMEQLKTELGSTNMVDGTVNMVLSMYRELPKDEFSTCPGQD